MVLRIVNRADAFRLGVAKARTRTARKPKVVSRGGFATQLKLSGLPPHEPEFRFLPGRRFRFDFAWPSLMVAAEREGGTWIGGRHSRGQGYANDAIKYAEAAILGWRLIRFTVDMERSGMALDLVRRAIEAARKEGPR